MQRLEKTGYKSIDWSKWFSYEEGYLYWVVNKGSTAFKGHVAGAYNSKGYLRVQLNNKKYYVHRIIYELLVRSIPEGYDIDHINNIRDDNRIENLRIATRQENCRNQSVRKTSKSGVKGVSFHKATQKYRALIHINGKQQTVGYFKTIEEAKISYNNKAKELYGEFAYQHEIQTCLSME